VPAAGPRLPPSCARRAGVSPWYAPCLIGEGLELFTTLQRLGVPSKMIYFPDEGHWINRPANSVLWYRTFVEWMDRWIK